MIESDAARPGAGEIKAWFQTHIASIVAITADEVDLTADFDSFGLDSVQGVDMITALEEHLGLDDDLPIEIIFDAASIADAADAIAAILAERRKGQ